MELGSPCLEWLGLRDKDGYGRAKIGGKMVRMHRRQFELEHGAIPSGLCVLHHCDNPPCVEPSHLYSGTHADNMRDRRNRGRYANALKTSCPNGHPYDGLNTYTYDSRRQCRACRHARGIAKSRKIGLFNPEGDVSQAIHMGEDSD